MENAAGKNDPFTAITDGYYKDLGGYYHKVDNSGPYFIGGDGSVVPLYGPNDGGGGSGGCGNAITEGGQFSVINEAGKTVQCPDVLCKQVCVYSYTKNFFVWQDGQPFYVKQGDTVWFRGLKNANQLSIGCLDADPSSSAHFYCRWER